MAVTRSNSTPASTFVHLFGMIGRPCSPKDRLGIYHHSNTLKVIEVRKAGCARFWIEFEYGKMLFPPIKDRSDLIAPSIIEVAEKNFGPKCVQGCHWCE